VNRAILAVLAACCAASLAACGGDEVQQLTADEARAIAQSLTSSLAGAGALQTTHPLRAPRDSGVAVKGTLACPVSGHVYSSGNYFASCPTPSTPGSCTISGVVNVNFGDTVSNAEDCIYPSGLVVDGGVTVMISGTDLATKLTFTSILCVARKGPTGGLVPLDICVINLVARTPSGTLTGSICGQPINQTL
jgi:hypothetical protein